MKHKLLPHAFRRRHICETQLTTVINDLAKIVLKSGFVSSKCVNLI